MIGTCKLCLRDGVELQRSHPLSAAVYRILQDDGSLPIRIPFSLHRRGRVQSNQQQWAHLLCRSCEALLSRVGEDWVFRHGMKQDGSFPLAELLRRSRPSVGTLGEHTRLYEAKGVCISNGGQRRDRVPLHSVAWVETNSAVPLWTALSPPCLDERPV
jgi:hypothetical protein